MKIRLNTPVEKQISATDAKILRMGFNLRGKFVIFIGFTDTQGNIVDRDRIILTDSQADTLFGNAKDKADFISRIYNQLTNNYAGIIEGEE
ncbi:MAG: hypothetical protein ACOCUD_03485 [Bacillota bacterium]